MAACIEFDTDHGLHTRTAFDPLEQILGAATNAFFGLGVGREHTVFVLGVRIGPEPEVDDLLVVGDVDREVLEDLLPGGDDLVAFPVLEGHAPLEGGRETGDDFGESGFEICELHPSARLRARRSFFLETLALPALPIPFEEQLFGGRVDVGAEGRDEPEVEELHQAPPRDLVDVGDGAKEPRTTVLVGRAQKIGILESGSNHAGSVVAPPIERMLPAETGGGSQVVGTITEVVGEDGLVEALLDHDERFLGVGRVD